MPTGFQCWDDAGNMVIDLTTRILKTYGEGQQYVNFPNSYNDGRNTFATISWPGINPTDTIVVAWYASQFNGLVPLGVSVGIDTIHLRREPEGYGSFLVSFQIFKF